MLFNFQGPCTFNKIFHLFLKCVIYFTTLESVCQDFFQTFFKKFFELFVNLQSRNQSVLYSLFTLFLIEKPLEYWLFKPLLFKFFTALSRHLHYITTLCEECQHLFWIFFIFLTIFLFSLFLTYI